MVLNTCKEGTLEVLKFPNAILRTRATAVDINSEQEKIEINKLADAMAETMYKFNGIGLAAPQVGVSKRIFVIDVEQKVERDENDEVISRQPGVLHVFINPNFVSMEGNTKFEEGCLSVPGVYELVSRSNEVTIEYYDRDFKKQTISASDIFAVVIQHEYDHLEGKLFIDKLPIVKRTMIKNRITKGKNL